MSARPHNEICNLIAEERVTNSITIGYVGPITLFCVNLCRISDLAPTRRQLLFIQFWFHLNRYINCHISLSVR